MIRSENMNILITGANRGLGLALVDHALNQGDTVIATERSTSDNLQKRQAEYPDNLHILQFDVTDEQAIASEKVRLVQTLNKVDVLINNAAILNGRDQSIEELSFEDSLKAFDINALGPARMIKQFLPLLRKGKEKLIINLSTDAASLTNAYPGDYPYGLSKVALNMLTEKLVRELKEDEIQTFAVHPGWMHTEMGGNQAPTNPKDTANNIYNMIKNRPKSTTGFQFFNHEGEMMDI